MENIDIKLTKRNNYFNSFEEEFCAFWRVNYERSIVLVDPNTLMPESSCMRILRGHVERLSRKWGISVDLQYDPSVGFTIGPLQFPIEIPGEKCINEGILKRALQDKIRHIELSQGSKGILAQSILKILKELDAIPVEASTR